MVKWMFIQYNLTSGISLGLYSNRTAQCLGAFGDNGRYQDACPKNSAGVVLIQTGGFIGFNFDMFYIY